MSDARDPRRPEPPLNRQRLGLIVGVLVGGLALVGLAVALVPGDDEPEPPEDYALTVSGIGPLEIGMSTADAEEDGEMVRRFFHLCRADHPGLTTAELQGKADGRAFAIDGEVVSIGVTQGAVMEPGGIQPGAPFAQLAPALGADLEVGALDQSDARAWIAPITRVDDGQQVFEVYVNPETELIAAVWTPRLIGCAG